MAVTSKITDHLLAAGSRGLHVNELSKLTNIIPNKLGRVLRLLAHKGCFKEGLLYPDRDCLIRVLTPSPPIRVVEPDVWANNRLSMELLSKQPTSALVGLL